MEKNIKNCILPVYEVNQTEFTKGSNNYLYYSIDRRCLDSFSAYAVTAVGLAILSKIYKCELLNNVIQLGEYFLDEFGKIQKKYLKIIKKVDGVGLMLGIWLDKKYNNEKVIQAFLENGLLTTGVGGNQLLHPLNLASKDIKKGLQIVKKVIDSL